MMRLAVIASHPVQYYTPLFRELATRVDLTVFYCHRDSPADQARAGFGEAFAWDVNLLSGYKAVFLDNVARNPGLGRFSGVDCPAVSDVLRAGRFDSVLIMGWYLKAFMQALIAARRIGLPAMVRGDSHLQTPRSKAKLVMKEVFYPLFLRQYAAALVVGTRNREYWRHYRYPEDRLFSSPHCVDTLWFASHATDAARADLRQEIGVCHDEKLVLFAGKLIELKRPLDCVDALARLQDSGLKVAMLIAGSGDLETAIRNRASECCVDVHFMGFQNQSAMPRAYAAADVLVLPSERETWGLVCNEALACGRPIVVSDAVGCAPDLANDGRVGQVYPLGDCVALAARLDAVFNSPPSQDEIASISSRFSLAEAAAGIVEAMTLISRRA